MKRLLSSLAIFSLLFFIYPIPANAVGIAFDTAVEGVAAGTGGGPFTYNHTVTGANTILIVSIKHNGVDNGVTSVTYNGVAMTQAIYKLHTVGTLGMYLYYLINPATGTHQVSVSVSSNPNQIGIYSASYTGVSQSATPDVGFIQNETASGDRVATVNVTTANSWLVDNFVSTTVLPSSVVNGVGHVNILGNNGETYDSNGPVGSGNQTIGFHWNSSDNHTILAMAIAPAAAASPSFQLWLMGLF